MPACKDFTLHIVIVPRASRNKVVRFNTDTLRVYVTSAPVGGQANSHLIKLLSKLMGHPKSAIAIIGGLKSRRKRLAFCGLPPKAGEIQLNQVLPIATGNAPSKEA